MVTALVLQLIQGVVVLDFENEEFRGKDEYEDVDEDTSKVLSFDRK